MAVCNKSGTIAVYNESKNLFLSPIIDGPVKFVNNLEGDLNIVPITRFGRSFSIVDVPYAFKLLYQELQTMNVQMPSSNAITPPPREIIMPNCASDLSTESPDFMTINPG